MDDDAAGQDVETIGRATEERIAHWNEVGRDLCGAFLEVAERVGATV